MAVDDSLLVAYVDGELDSSACAEVEAQIVRSPELQQMVNLLRQSTAAVSVAFDEALYGPMPELTPPAEVFHWRHNLGATITTWLLLLRPAVVPISAVALIAGVVLGRLWFLGAPPPADVAQAVDQRVITGTLTKALEFNTSGSLSRWRSGVASGFIKPLRTFVTKDGRFCREFEQSSGKAQGSKLLEKGLACRDSAGGWQVLVRYPVKSQAI
ncbi:MAG TPA: hypothetical protein ENI62_15475 [Gammaproteobacteria bacterium]|nr:hypothetical protein [Gammaproteobacteria bacterium]